MSKISAGLVQVGISASNDKNFQLDATADNGILEINRQDLTNVLTIGADNTLTGAGAIYSGATNDIDDFDKNWPSGVYRAVENTVLNGPGSEAYYLSVEVMKNSIGTVYIASRVTGNINNSRTWIGTRATAGSTLWTEVYTQSSILGTVTQSAGVPTGAILEYDSNLNGEYIKFADGTLICSGLSATVTTNNTWGTFYTNPQELVTYPADYIDPPTLSCSSETWTTYVGFSAGLGLNVTQGRVQAFSGSNIATCKLRWSSIGRWY